MSEGNTGRVICGKVSVIWKLPKFCCGVLKTILLELYVIIKKFTDLGKVEYELMIFLNNGTGRVCCESEVML